MMKRASLLAVLLLIVSALPAGAEEKWYEAYKRGVTAVNQKGYRAAADALQKAIAEMPNESTSVRAGREIIVYVPHFWLGIAKFNLDEVDAALKEWRISEEQGAITRTEYYARMKDWVSRAQTEKQRNAQSQASGPRKEADAAISKALAMQVDALSAGGDRSESYRSAQRKLQEALSQFHQAGTNVSAYQTAGQTAQQAAALFVSAAEEGKKLRAARQPAPAAPKPAPVKQPVLITNVPRAEGAQPAVKLPPPANVDTAPPAPPVESEAKVAARVAVQELRRSASQTTRNTARETREADRLRRELDAATTDAEFERIGREARDREAAMKAPVAAAVIASPAPIDVTPVTKPDLGVAFRAYASGDLQGSEQALTTMIRRRSSPEALLLRGCVRYTQAMLSRERDRLLAAAASDFRAALQSDRALRLDRRAFSPKLVAFFEQVRETR
jgi:hypothetical protein